MSVLASQISDYIQKSSWIRKMFEQGIELKKQYGKDNVYDFSLGNPDVPPPDSVTRGLQSIAANARSPYAFSYMPNAGYPETRELLADWLSQDQGTKVTADDVLLTCGAAGGLNVLFRAVLEPGDEVICPAPYFVEYYFYASNHGGVLKSVPAVPPDFHMDLEGMAGAISERTKIVLINSPNNPTGHVYDPKELRELAEILKQKSKQYGHTIFLVSDEPYRFLTFDGHQVPSLLPIYENSVVVSSFSKNLSLAGERIGYILLNPVMEAKQELMGGIIFTNRILGFVNAPAVGQQILKYVLGTEVDVQVFEKRRELMKQVLEIAGYNFLAPKGGFYFFPQAPGGDDVSFCSLLQEERVLAVPGSGFGFSGYMRMSFCVEEEVIANSQQSLAKAREKMK